MIQPLVVTPIARKHESLWGLLLRISESNGYETPRMILDYAGLTYAESMRCYLPLGKLAPVLYRDRASLEKIAWMPVPNPKRVTSVTLEGHILSVGSLLLQRPKICPHCVREAGYVKSIWDIRLMVGCAKHGCQLIWRCPACRRPLSRFRQGPLRCTCGGDLTSETPPDISSTASDLLRLIEGHLYGDATHSVVLYPGMPNTDLQGLSLQGLLALIEILGTFAMEAGILGYRPVRSPTPVQRVMLVEGASRVLVDWPAGLHNMMSELERNHKAPTPRRQYGTLSLRTKFHRLYAALFKYNTTRSEYAFVMQAFINYGLIGTHGSLVDNRLLRNNGIDPTCRKVVSLRELSRITKYSVITLKKFIEEGTLKAERVSVGPTVRYFIDRDAIAIKQLTTHNPVLSSRKAAAYIDLPEMVVKGLGQRRLLRTQKMRGSQFGYSTADLDAMRNRINDICQPVDKLDAPAKTTVLLSELLAKKFYNNFTKAGIIEAIINRTITPLGRFSERLADVVLPRREVTLLIRDSMCNYSGDTCTVIEASKTLSCSQLAICALMRVGLLEFKKTQHGRRIANQSVREFNSKYIMLARVSRILNISYFGALKLCEDWNVDVHVFSISSDRKGNIRWVHRHHLPSLGVAINA